MAYQLEEAKKLVIQAGLDMIEKGLIARTWGNISGRISESQFVITPSGRAYESPSSPRASIGCRCASGS